MKTVGTFGHIKAISLNTHPVDSKTSRIDLHEVSLLIIAVYSSLIKLCSL